MPNIMLDLETYGTSPGCAIASIGAVEFHKNVVGRRFYTVVNLFSCMEVDLEVDQGTMHWWNRQPDDAKLVLGQSVAGGESLRYALMGLSSFIKSLGNIKPEDVYVWGNGSDFDNAILKACYEAVGLELPWPPFNNRCYRTLKNLVPDIPFVRQGVHHNALDDAISQAEHASRILTVLDANLNLGGVACYETL